MYVMSTLDYAVFDADNHYYESTDAFTRHIDPSMRKRCIQWAEIGGKQRILVGGKVNKFIPNPLFDPVAKPGSLEDYFRGRNLDGKDMMSMFGDLDPLADQPAVDPDRQRADAAPRRRRPLPAGPSVSP